MNSIPYSRPSVTKLLLACAIYFSVSAVVYAVEVPSTPNKVYSSPPGTKGGQKLIETPEEGLKTYEEIVKDLLGRLPVLKEGNRQVDLGFLFVNTFRFKEQQRSECFEDGCAPLPNYDLTIESSWAASTGATSNVVEGSTRFEDAKLCTLTTVWPPNLPSYLPWPPAMSPTSIIDTCGGDDRKTTVVHTQADPNGIAMVVEPSFSIPAMQKGKDRVVKEIGSIVRNVTYVEADTELQLLVVDEKDKIARYEVTLETIAVEIRNYGRHDASFRQLGQKEYKVAGKNVDRDGYVTVTVDANVPLNVSVDASGTPFYMFDVGIVSVREIAPQQIVVAKKGLIPGIGDFLSGIFGREESSVSGSGVSDGGVNWVERDGIFVMQLINEDGEVYHEVPLTPKQELSFAEESEGQTLAEVTVDPSSVLVGSRLNVRWSSESVSNVNIELLNYKTENVERVIEKSISNKNEYEWTVPEGLDDDVYRIRVSDASNSAVKSISDKFDIEQAGPSLWQRAISALGRVVQPVLKTLGVSKRFAPSSGGSATPGGPHPRYCTGDNSDIFTGIAYETEYTPNITVKVDPAFELALLSTKPAIPELPLAPVYDLVVTAVPIVNEYCLPQWDEDGHLVAKVDPPETLPFPGHIIIGESSESPEGIVFVAGPGSFKRAGKFVDSRKETDQWKYEWKLKGWTNGIADEAKMVRLFKAIKAKEPINVRIDVERKNQPTVYEKAPASFSSCQRLGQNGEIVWGRKKVITVGGAGAPSRDPLFTWIEKLAPDSSVISGLKGVDKNTERLRAEIKEQLERGYRVLVIGHSLGSIVVFNIQSEFENKCVEFLFLDPPYDTCLIKTPGIKNLSASKAIQKACDAGIADDKRTVDWTKGQGLMHFFRHHPFLFPWYRNNRENLDKVFEVLYQFVNIERLEKRLLEGKSVGTVNGKAGMFTEDTNPSSLVAVVGAQAASQSAPSVITRLSKERGPVGTRIDIRGNAFGTRVTVYLENDSGGFAWTEGLPVKKENGLDTVTYTIPAEMSAVDIEKYEIRSVPVTEGHYSLSLSEDGREGSDLVSFEVTAGKADSGNASLFISTPVLTGASAGAGKFYAGPVTVASTITNRSAAAMTRFPSVFQYSSDGVAWSDGVGFDVPELAKGIKAEVTHSWKVNPGTWFFRICAKAVCSGVLRVEALVRGGAISPSVGLPSGKAVIISSRPVITGTQVGAGKLKVGSMRFSAEATNTGDGVSRPFQSLLQYSRDDVNWSDWVQIDLPPLPPAQTSDINYSWNGGEGVWYVRACDDISDECSPSTRFEVVP